ncbi:hypothetical protein [Brevibacillus reuszeri]|uniref:hypothetical protein n=1 Tax=Brevibacillus reuszeri TaxID=54915 RepID=UPI00289E525E|nr:hypothetical protein [Brevibacillus reuszeri]
MSIFHLEYWTTMDTASQTEALKSLERSNGHAFSFKTIETFSSVSGNFTTGLFELDGKEYIFIPGSKVTLGWSEADMRDEIILSAIEKELEIAGISQSATDYLQSVFSPRREAVIATMLVERNVQTIVSKPGHLANYHEILQDLELHGFSLPTEDEWEYLCGGGTQRIFSEHINEDLIVDICREKQYYSNLEKPNHFGLYIAYEPYLFELVNSPVISKGGDGGTAAHGGYHILGVLPISPHYRDEVIQELMSSDGDFDCDVSARRIVRLET